MELDGLHPADKHLLYGYLLRRRRGFGADRSVLEIMRSRTDLDAKIAALLGLDEAAPAAAADSPAMPRPRQGGRKWPAVVVDASGRLARVLRRCALRHRLVFTRVQDGLQALPLIRHLGARLLILKDGTGLPDPLSYAAICRAVQPFCRLVLLSPEQAGPAEVPPPLAGNLRILAKPISIEQLERTVWELLELAAVEPTAQRNVATSSR